MASEVTVNPHNQTFAIAIQLGVMGTLALWACGLRISCYFEAVALPHGSARGRQRRLFNRALAVHPGSNPSMLKRLSCPPVDWKG
jgi:hypothetical protein